MNDAVTITSLHDLELLIRKITRFLTGLNNLGVFIPSGVRHNVYPLALREYAQKYGLQIHEPTIGTDGFWVRVEIGAGCIIILNSLPTK